MRPPAHALALAAVFVLATTVGPTAVDVPSDLPVYRGYAQALLDGLVPYRDFAVEYPPLALAPIGLAGLAGLGADTYAWAFGALMLVAALAVQHAAAALAPPRHRRAVAWAMVLLPVAAGAIVRTRFDLVPAALMLAGLAAVLAARPRAGFALLAAGAATKLFPAVPAAAALVWLARRAGDGAPRRAVATFAAVLALATVPFLLASPAGFADQFAFHLERPVQIESAPATVLWVLGDSEVTGAPVAPDRFKSNGLRGGAAPFLAGFFAVLQLAAVAAAAALAARRPGNPDQLVVAAFAALLAFVALGKVLSPQYLLWLAPLALAAYARGARAAAALTLAAVPLTQLEFPHRYFELVDGDAVTIALVAARNGLLLAALALALRWLVTER